AATALGNASADELLDRLSDWQREDGGLDRGALAEGGSEGARLRQIEAAALATIVWSRAGRESDLDAAERAARWLARHRREDGGFGDPRITALALQGLFDLHARRPRPPAHGVVVVSAGERPLGRVEVSPG